jgi:sarcosine oxidase, subunit beta
VAETRKAVVVGGGALGASSALALAQRGFEVTLHERRSLGSGATGKAAGILSTLCHSDAEYRLIAETRGLVGELMSLAMAAGCREARGAWRSHPSIVVGGGQTLATLDAMQDRVERFTEECERLDHRQAERAFPGVQFAPGEQVLVAQEDGVLEAGDLMAALRAQLGSEGVRIMEGNEAPTGQAAPSIAGDDVLVVAGGAWTKGSLATWPDLGCDCPCRCTARSWPASPSPAAASCPSCMT